MEPDSLADYVAAMSRAVFTAGMNWSVIDAKWDDTVAAFQGFDPETVAAYSPDDVERLMGDPGVIHNRKKIEAVIANAGEAILVDREFGGFERYLESFDTNEALAKDLHKRFKFLGESVAHYFLYSVSFRPEEQEAWARAYMAAREQGSAR